MSLAADLMVFPAADQVERIARSRLDRGGAGVTDVIRPAEPFRGVAALMTQPIDMARSRTLASIQRQVSVPGHMVPRTQDATNAPAWGTVAPSPAVSAQAPIPTFRQQVERANSWRGRVPQGSQASQQLQPGSVLMPSTEPGVQRTVDVLEEALPVSEAVDVRPEMWDPSMPQVVRYSDADLVDDDLSGGGIFTSNALKFSPAGTPGAMSEAEWYGDPRGQSLTGDPLAAGERIASSIVYTDPGGPRVIARPAGSDAGSVVGYAIVAGAAVLTALYVLGMFEHKPAAS